MTARRPSASSEIDALIKAGARVEDIVIENKDGVRRIYVRPRQEMKAESGPLNAWLSEHPDFAA